MANITITRLPTALPLTGTESVPIVQNGQTVQTTTGAISSAPNQQQTFITQVQESTLPNSRYLSTGTGLGITDGGAQSYLRLSLNAASGSLETALTGIIAKDNASSVVARTIQTSGAGLSIANGNGVSGNPVLSLSGLVSNLANASGTGFLSVVGGATIASRQIYGTAGQIGVLYGNGSDNPIISIVPNAVMPGSEALTLPLGSTAERPSGYNGQVRFNTTSGTFEGFSSGAWRDFSLTGGVTLIDTGTGLTGGPITSTGTISIDTGVVATLTGTQTLTNKTISGSNNTLSNIGNASLTNSAITINGSPVSLGGSVSVGTVTSVTGTAPVVSSGGTTPAISMPAATGSVDGYLTSTDWTTFNSKQPAGTYVNSVSGTAGRITSTGGTTPVIDLASGVATAGTTGSSTLIPVVTIDTYGRVTSITTASNPQGTVTSITAGTGLTGGTITSTGTIAIDSTVATLSGTQTLTNKTISGSSNTLSNIGNSSLTNSSVTFNGTTVSLGGSGTITATATNALTIGTGLSGTSYNGSTPVTIAIDSTVATLTGTQTFTNKSISGSTNTLTNIPNSALTNSSVTIGSTAISLGATSLTLAGLTSVTLTQDPSADLQAATKQYVDNLVSTGLAFHQPVQAATTASLASTTGGTVTYNNGASGVGATITLSVALTTLDGYSLANTNRILVKNEVNQAYNGIYTWATGGTVLTRATDANSYGSGVNQLSQNDYFFVQNGTVNKGSSFVVTTVGTITFGTTAITFSEFSNSQVYSAGTGLTLTGTTFSITNTGVTNASYGTASSVPTIAVNAQGQITSASNTSIAINGNQITSGVVGTAYGGTALSSFTSGGALYATSTSVLTSGTLPITAGGTGITAFGTGVQTALGQAVTGSGGIVLATSPTLVTPALGTPSAVVLTNATGLPLTSGVTGTLPVANGGTGQSSNLTQYGVIYGSTTTAMASTAAGTTTTVLHGNASGAPTFGAVSLTADVSGTLPIANGGTNSTATPTAGGAGYGTGTAHAYTAAGTAGQVLTSAGASAPVWSGIAGGTF
jgi:hypothetical protein